MKAPDRLVRGFLFILIPLNENKCSFILGTYIRIGGRVFMNGLLTKSIEDKISIEIIYLNSQGEVSQRVIRVLSSTDHHVKAYCYAKKQIRTFKMENILSTGTVRKRLSA